MEDGDLAGSRFDRCYMLRAVLIGSLLAGASLRQTVLTGAALERTDFTGADLTGALLNGARLDGAVFRGARLGESRFTNAVPAGADFERGRGRPGPPHRDAGGGQEALTTGGTGPAASSLRPGPPGTPRSALQIGDYVVGLIDPAGFAALVNA